MVFKENINRRKKCHGPRTLLSEILAAPPDLMKLLSWNPRGPGNPRGIQNLHALLTREVPDMLFLQETRLKACQWSLCKYKLSFLNCFVVDAIGRSGGLTLLWKNEIDLKF